MFNFWCKTCGVENDRRQGFQTLLYIAEHVAQIDSDIDTLGTHIHMHPSHPLFMRMLQDLIKLLYLLFMMSSMLGKTSSTSQPILYFAYGSNMHLHQMAARCPTSVFMGVGILRGWKWQINERGVANIVKSHNHNVEGIVYDIDQGNKRQLDRNEGVSKGFYDAKCLKVQVVLSSKFKALKTGYVARALESIPMPTVQVDIDQDTATIHPCPPRAGSSPTQSLGKKAQQQTGSPSQFPVSGTLFDDSKADPGVLVPALVYISEAYKTDGDIRTEYVARMEKAIVDGRKLGLSAPFLSQVERCIHGRQLHSCAAHSNNDRSIPSQHVRSHGTCSNHGRSIPSQQDAINRASDQHHHAFKGYSTRRGESTKWHDGDRPRKRRNSL